MVTIDETTLAMTFALLGVVFSIAYVVLLLYGLDTLRGIREELGNGD